MGDVEIHDIVRELGSLGEAGERLVALANEEMLTIETKIEGVS